jgi:LPS sulfotransferase NodH
MTNTTIEFRRNLEQEGVHRSFSIAFSLRCGSTVLSELLSNSGVGAPTEYFQYPYEQGVFLRDEKQTGFTSAFSSLVMKYSASGIFGSKMTHDHRAHLDGVLRKIFPDFVTLSDVLPNHKWIFVDRRDVIAQAISLYVAERVGVWHVVAGEGRAASYDRVEYDFFDILSKLMILLANNANWQLYFSTFNIVPLRLHYEDLCEDSNAVFKSIFEYLGESHACIPALTIESGGNLRKISNDHKELYNALKKRFSKDFLDLGQSDDLERLGEALPVWGRFFSERQWNCK